MSKKEQNLITGGQYGQNIVIVIDGVKHSKKIEDKEKRAEILKLRDEYNSSFKATIKKKILSLVATSANVVKAKTKVIKKVTKVLSTIEDFEKAESLSKTEIQQYKKLLLEEQTKKKQIVNQPIRRGER